MSRTCQCTYTMLCQLQFTHDSASSPSADPSMHPSASSPMAEAICESCRSSLASSIHCQPNLSTGNTCAAVKRFGHNGLKTQDIWVSIVLFNCAVRNVHIQQPSVINCTITRQSTLSIWVSSSNTMICHQHHNDQQSALQSYIAHDTYITDLFNSL